MKPATFAWPPPREIRNVCAGRNMASLPTTKRLRVWAEPRQEEKPAPPAVKREQFIRDKNLRAVRAVLTEARDLGKPLTKTQILARCHLAEATCRDALKRLMALNEIVQDGTARGLRRAIPTWRARHIGEDAPLLKEPPPVPWRDRFIPHLIAARDSGLGITRQQLAEVAGARWTTVASVIDRMRSRGEVRSLGPAPFRKLHACRPPLLYAATEKL